MTSEVLCVHAPGKAIVCGEYAVLDGAPAISIAVDRHVVAKIGEGPRSQFVHAALTHAARALRDPALERLRVVVDSQALYEQHGKIGLRSSAAVTSAVVGLAFAQAGVSLDERARLFSIADAAHAEAQGVTGSGIDVATSIYGGAICFLRHPERAPSISSVPWPAELRLSFVFSGTSASTPELVARVRQLRERDATRYADCIAALHGVATDFAEALTHSNAYAALNALGRWQPALSQLGSAADAPIVTRFFDTVARLSSKHGAAAKPSGAGGGDLGLIAHIGPIDALRADLAHEHIKLIDLIPHGPAVGLSLEKKQ